MQLGQLRRPRNENDEKREEDAAVEADSDIIALYNRSLSRSRVLNEAEDHVSTLKQINRALTRFKLSKNEVKVYLFLARYGSQKAQQIAESMDIHRTEAYKTLRTLEAQGLIARILEKPMKFAALPFEQVLENLIEARRKRIIQLEQRKTELLEMWRSLPEVEEFKAHKETLQILEGKRQVLAKVSELLSSSEAEFQAVVSDNEMVWLYNSLFFEDLNELMKEKTLDARMMAQYSPTSTYIIEKTGLYDMDFAFLRRSNQPSFFIADDKEILLLMNNEENKLLAMWTNYEAVVASFRNLFEHLWNSPTLPKKASPSLIEVQE
jgi:sugar-specific transcriptional regulator TrmB